MIRLILVVVNFRTAHLAIKCLRSVSSQTSVLDGGRVIVIDNASCDGSVEHIADAIRKERWGGWAEVVPLTRNGGFSYGNNCGIAYAKAAGLDFSHVMLLNPDAVLREGALEQLLGFITSASVIGVAGCRIENANGDIEQSAHQMPRAFDELLEGARLNLLERAFRRGQPGSPLNAQPRPCDWVSGAGMIIRREVIDQIGLFDEGFFLYFEEVDFCRRAKAAGWEVWYAPPSTIVHVEGASTGITKSTLRRPAYWFASRRRFFVKAYGIGSLILADLLRVVGRLSFLLRKALHLGAATRFDYTPPHFMRDMLWGDLKALFSGELRGIRR